ncbi:hypothetical protein MLD38_020351 [Melastoma candidum]|uniref:Uncharacterized protein n=1 Tax=Melastoma candidum TaxID=119954 RepID=A0ACB9QCM9_9MYRT|nr:hypothetical protein MLD38_020351 [Melastoma candidum]
MNKREMGLGIGFLGCSSLIIHAVSAQTHADLWFPPSAYSVTLLLMLAMTITSTPLSRPTSLLMAGISPTDAPLGGSVMASSPPTSSQAISLPQQLNYYKELQSKVVNSVGRMKAATICSKGAPRGVTSRHLSC